MAKNKLKFFLILLVITILIQPSVEQQCNSAGLKRLDSTAAKLITIGNSGRKFPENKGKDLKKFCRQSEAYIIDMENYKKNCMKDLPKQVSGVLIYTIKNTINQLCKKDSKRLTDLISSTPCLNKANNEINKCYTRLIDSLLGAKNAADKNKIPHLCCEYFKIFQCIKTRALPVESCNEFKVEVANDFIRSIAGNVVDLICGDYIEGSDKCETLGPVPKKDKKQRRAKSFVIPMIDLLASFPEI